MAYATRLALSSVRWTLRWQYALSYLDDIVIFSRTPQEHIGHVRKVLTLLHDAGVTLQLKKCKFFTETINYLGHVIRPRRLDISSHTTDAIRGLKALTSLTELRSFLGLCNVFRRFVPNFARLAAPLHQRLKKDQPATFGSLNEEELNSMNSLKNALISPPVLALPNNSGHLTLDTDACNVQVGCVLLQQQPDDTTKPIGYWSRS